MQPKVSIFMAVYNGASWLADVLNAVTAQTYPNIEVTVWDNGSTDATPGILNRYPNARHIRRTENTGFWMAMEQLIANSDSPYIICLTDVVLHSEFVSEAIAAMQRDTTIGTVQGKIYEQHRGATGAWVRSAVIDALGFRLQRSRRVTILGHGEADRGQYDAPMQIFAVEGAVPVFRRAALDDCRMPASPPGGEGFCVSDPAYRVGGITYGDDLDLGWRMTLLGWRQVMVPTAIGWHDRSTTKATGAGLAGRIGRRHMRAAIGLAKRRLDWSNVRFTIIKNDHILNLLRDSPWIISWELAVQGYMLLFEARALAEWGRFFRLIPLMLRRRSIVQRRARLTATRMRQWIT